MRALLPLTLLCACDLDGWNDSGDEPASLSDILDLSVNDASATVSDGLTLRTEAGDNEVGGFNGSGTGNKAIAGLPGWDGLALGELDGLSVETSLVTGSTTPYYNLVLDLGCDGASYKVIVADATVATAEDLGGGVTRYSYAADSAQWRAVAGLDDLLPEHLASEAGALSDVAAAYPCACLRDADTGDNGLPADTVTSAVMIILGDSLNHSEHEHLVSALEVAGTRYE